MTTTLVRFNGYSLSAFICGVLAAVGNFFALVLAVVADSMQSEAILGLAGLSMGAAGLFALWAVAGGIVALNTPVQRSYSILSVVLGGLSLLWLLVCVVAGAASS